MTQEQLNTIVKIVQNGAPALANELIQSLVDVLNENASLKESLTKESNEEKSKKETN